VPIVVAIVLHALWSLRQTAVRDVRDLVVVAAALIGAVLGIPELLVLLLVGVASVTLRVPIRGVGSVLVLPAASLVTPSLLKLFLVFLQIGSVIYGSGYVLLVFLESEVVARDWITSEVLLDAVSVGQFTPGPVFTTATFIGWHISGVAGALLATIGIFGPSFVFAGLVERVMSWSQRSARFSAFLRGVSSGSIALMAVVVWRLASEVFEDALAVGICAVALAALVGNSLRK
jgi:chromate transporter